MTQLTLADALCLLQASDAYTQLKAAEHRAVTEGHMGRGFYNCTRSARQKLAKEAARLASKIPGVTEGDLMRQVDIVTAPADFNLSPKRGA